MDTLKMGLTIKQISDALYKTEGNISAAARALKVRRSALNARIARSEELQLVVEDAREMMLDEAENALGKAIKRGDGWAVCFALKTVGKKRGYIEKTETDTNIRGTVEHIVVKPKANDSKRED